MGLVIVGLFYIWLIGPLKTYDSVEHLLVKENLTPQASYQSEGTSR